MPLVVTPVVVSILLVCQVVITNFVGYRRLKTGIHFLDGGDLVLTRRMRAHGNFTETVPITLIGLLTAELMGAAPAILWIGSGLLLIGRAWHFAVIVTQGWGNGRAMSMVLTFASMVIFAGAIVWRMF